MKKNWTSVLSISKGYTIVELMIVVAITGVLITFGISAYGKARERQVGQASGEKIVGILQESQKKANIGNRDCNGVFTGIRVTVSSPNVLTSVSLCDGDTGTAIVEEVENVTSITTGVITFNPLSRGITLPSSPFNLDYVSVNGTTYRIQVNSSGTIEYQGIQQP